MCVRQLKFLFFLLVFFALKAYFGNPPAFHVARGLSWPVQQGALPLFLVSFEFPHLAPLLRSSIPQLFVKGNRSRLKISLLANLKALQF
jgi:hypothetical protein